MRAVLALVAVLVAAGTVALLAGGRATTDAAGPPITTAAAATPCRPLSPGGHRLTSIAGRIPVVVHVGRTARPGGALILALPGAKQTASDFATYTGYSALADRDGFSVAYPTATGTQPFWNVSGTTPGKPDDVAYLRQVIAAAVAATCADAARVGVTGVSNGGGMAARLACDAADLVAAAAPVAGGYSTLPACHPSRPVPMLEIHGQADQVVPYDGTGSTHAGAITTFLAQWRRLDGCSGSARRTAPDGDVAELRWATCSGGTIVQHDRISDADHGWPGEDDLQGSHEFASTPRTWAFLSSFRR